MIQYNDTKTNALLMLLFKEDRILELNRNMDITKTCLFKYIENFTSKN